MQAELELIDSTVEIQILGVNAVGNESGNSTMTEGRVLPWLQDVAEQEVWSDWAVTFRDVVILDTDNTVYSVYNLTEYDLADTANYEALKALLIAATAP